MGALGLKFVAAGTTLLSLVIMCLALMSPLILLSSYWDTDSKKATLLLFSLLLGVGQIWLNTINSQFYLCLFSVYLLLSKSSQLREGQFLYCSIMLMIAVLTGVTSVILLPFFLLKLFHKKQLQPFSTSKVDWIFFLIIVFGLIVQLVAFYYSLSHGGYGPRLHIRFISNFPNGFLSSLLWIVHGEWQGASSQYAISIIFGPFLLYSLYRAIKDDLESRYLVTLALYISLMFTLLSLGMAGGSRYTYVVSVVLLILFIQQASGNRNVLLKRTAFIALAFIVLIKIPSYFYTKVYYDHNWDTYESQFNKAISGEQNFIRVYPQRPDRDWRILLHRVSKQDISN